MRVLEARQLSLKYIANVTYGYTSATFSGRMPAVEIADAIVQSGRETLEKVLDTINTHIRLQVNIVFFFFARPLNISNQLPSGGRELYTGIPIRYSYICRGGLKNRPFSSVMRWRTQ